MTAQTARRVLLTGASGVLGQELLSQLKRVPDIEPVCLVHRTVLADQTITTVRGDIARPQLGLDGSEYRSLVDSVDAVVNSAAVVAFNGTERTLRSINVEGTSRIAQLAAAADAPLYHVSTAYIGARSDGAGESGARYASSKREAEDVVRGAGVPYAILRPSIIVGHSDTGAIASFQGFYQMVARFLHDKLPIIPFSPDSRIDLVPVDYVAEAVVAAVRKEALGSELWLANGPAALTLTDVVDMALDIGRDFGYPAKPPMLISGTVLDESAITDPALYAGIMKAVAYFSAYVRSSLILPTSADELAALGVRPLPDARTVADRSMRYWAARDARSNQGTTKIDRAAVAGSSRP
ncbi:hypothetical protein ThrDRAFT_04224 [Frankia casuarinae]|jgi:nucleoside-diphosphate-sugar epimerase|uniref:Male sterility-like n=1 Tax=Frankia casuarinae (strain DSM 45818 / CECT 9043 / HFP020203 / CcI3) TaxID=106370 RepID=Q2J806_FRACC|nr:MULTISPECIES: SDR family oxidoreductase [Frankia]ABD12586.1 Male sterility-like [Frankia casuarinae]ETA00236.1 hypothetical protein CcI6DRAFT_04347 [Frankia sp. CcI6]EYT90157.1 hypothetical protein ThrDRAFT_04224 [Frankia casuarinae]KDA41832.1 hypothetical protein BMG523Draft_03303 [Frankia sp. BMG5.23]KFB02905.1 Male sterility protein [Frankia sp. Allo2]